MLDDYRIRLLQVKAEENNNPLGQCFTAIVNTVAYITSVLGEWSELPVSSPCPFLPWLNKKESPDSSQSTDTERGLRGPMNYCGTLNLLLPVIESWLSGFKVSNPPQR